MIKGGDVPEYCPECQGTLKYRDMRDRGMKMYHGIKYIVSCPRYKCTNCGRLHKALPEQLTPYKHYATEVIENVVDGVSTPEDEQTDDYPCVGTMKNWKKEIAEKKSQIDGNLKSEISKFPGYEELLNYTGSLLDKLRSWGQGWLSEVNRAIYNSGRSSAGRSRPDDSAPAFGCVKNPADVPSSLKEGKSNEKPGNYEMAGRRGVSEISDDHTAAGSGHRQRREAG